MKKRVVIISILLILAISLVGILVACKGQSTDSTVDDSKNNILSFIVDGKEYSTSGDGTITFPQNPTKDGYIFEGWVLEDGSAFTANSTLAGKLSVYAKWRLKHVEIESGERDGINLYLDVASNVDRVNLIETLTVPSEFSWQLYDSTGQTLIPTKIVMNLKNGENIYYVVTNFKNNTTTYTLNIYKQYYVTISYMNGESEHKSELVLTHTTLGVGPAITREGYTFSGWGSDGHYVTEAKSFTAKWQANQYTVTLNVNGGNVSVETKDVTFDSTFVLPTATKTGYSFEGWYTANDGGTQLTNLNGESISNWNIANNTTVYARWGIIQYPVNLIKNEDGAGTVEGGGPTDYGKSVTINATTNLGFVWLGWFDEDTQVTSNLEYTFNMPAEEKTYTAKWEMDPEMQGLLFNSTTTSCLITGYEANLKPNVTIPSYVTSIEDSAFSGCSSLQSIKIPESVTSIGKSAFSGCRNLISVTLPFVGGSKTATVASAETLFGYIFGESSYTGGTPTKQYYSLSYAKTYYIPTSLTNVKITGGNILYGAFYNCSGLTSVTLSISVTGIGSYAFYNCSGLNSITLPASVTSIGSYAFSGCDDLTSIELPEGITSIEEGTFSGCSSLASITIPVNVTSIGDSTFIHCIGLTSITIPKDVANIGEEAFMNCSSLTSISVDTNNTNYHSSNNCLIKTATSTLILGCNNSVIPTDGSVTTIGNFAFYNCSELTSITIPVSVTGIGLYAFCDCIGLTSITIPKDVENIGYLAFRGCSGLTSISVDTNNINYHSSNNCLITTSTSTLILGCNNSIIPTDGSVTTIGKNAFYNCSELNSITISTNVTSIEERVFYGCSALTQITYSGTMLEFEEIEKDPLWNEESSIQKVICTDGDIVI